MAISDTLGCSIYFEANEPSPEIAGWLAERLHGSVETRSTAVEVHTPHAELEIRRNPQVSSGRTGETPNGFLYFARLLEVYFDPQCSLEDRVALVSTVLNTLWSRGLPAVAACDFEDRLPERGGYRRPAESCNPLNLPAPGANTASSVPLETRKT
jgi:hypothetical protein